MRWHQWAGHPWQGAGGGAVTSPRGLVVLLTGTLVHWSSSLAQIHRHRKRLATLRKISQPQMSQVKNESQLCKTTHRCTLRLKDSQKWSIDNSGRHIQVQIQAQGSFWIQTTLLAEVG